MTRYAAFLRGMNVGGHRITNDELRAAFAKVGFDDVATFRASGNVVLDHEDGEDRAALSARIEEGLEAELGYAVPVFLRSTDEMTAIAQFEPFEADRVAGSKGKLQVMLLTAAPEEQAAAEALGHATDDDLLALHDSELYWLPSGGTIDSELDLKAIAKLIGMATMRTKGTVDLIAAKFF